MSEEELRLQCVQLALSWAEHYGKDPLPYAAELYHFVLKARYPGDTQKAA